METNSAEEKKLLSLEAQMRQMVNASDFSDVAFLCNDGKQVRAHRMILAGSSDVLKRMLTNGMMESSLPEIALPEFSSMTLLAVLEFLYTRNALVDHRPQTWTIACEVMRAAEFFLIPGLKSATMVSFQDQVHSMASNPKKLASLLTEALQVNDVENGVDDKLRDTLLWEAVKHLAVYSFHLDYIPSLSQPAFNYLLANSKVNYEDGEVSSREYKRFKQIIYWWVCRSDLGSRPSQELEKLLDCMLPVKDTSSSQNAGHETSGETSGESDATIVARLSNKWKTCQFDAKPRNSAIKLLANINFRLIPPIIVSEVVKPLKIVPIETILDSFEFHAVKKFVDHNLCRRVHLCWSYSDSFKISQKGRLIQRAAENVGLAILEVPMAAEIRWSRTWKFTVEELCEDFIEVGLFFNSYEAHAKKSKFDGERLSNQDCAKVVKFQGSKLYYNVEGPGGRVHWKLLMDQPNLQGQTGVEFSYTGSPQTCAFSFCLNGILLKNLPMNTWLWDNLPSRLCCPAVSFGASSKGRVRLEP